MINRHSRHFAVSSDKIAPWIASSWSGTEADPFPRDVIRTWRKNPEGIAPLALVPTLTRVGHGPFRFRFESWDGHRFRVIVDQDGFRGWHGFDITQAPQSEGGCVVTHTISLDLSGAARVLWPLVIAPIHDWAVEATFDRIAAALATGHVPERTKRRMPLRAALAFRLLKAMPPITRARELHEMPQARLRDLFLDRYLADR